jgi:RimJ/RimL family protein N-acetyltransferase
MPELVVPDRPLTDGVIALRPFTLDDLDWVTEGCQDPGVARFTGVPQPYTLDHAREWIDGHAERQARGEAMHLAVTAADDGAPLGAVALQGLNWTHVRAEIGYWVGPWARGRETAPRAVRVMAAHAFEIGLHRIEILPYVDNPASQRVAEKAGAHREGVLRSYFLARGERHDCVMYSLLPGDL